MLGAMATLPLPDRLQDGAGGESRAVIARFDPLQTQLFERHQIEVPLLRFGNPAKRWFRISAQAYNGPEDYTHLTKALRMEISRGDTPTPDNR
jgi:hypothetical protein